MNAFFVTTNESKSGLEVRRNDPALGGERRKKDPLSKLAFVHTFFAPAGVNGILLLYLDLVLHQHADNAR